MRNHLWAVFILTIIMLIISSNGLEAQKNWTWYIQSTNVVSGSPGYIDVTIALRADSLSDQGRLGNNTLQGSMSGDLYDFNPADPTNDPIIQTNHLTSYTMTLTNPPGTNNWQRNCLYNGSSGNGALVDTAGIPVTTLRFFILNPAGTSDINLGTLQQTYEDDNSTLANVTYDNSGGDVPLSDTLTGLDIFEPVILKDFKLHQNFPNPFNPVTTIRFDIPLTGIGLIDTRLVIYNSLGQTIRTLYQDKLNPGSYNLQWDGSTDFGNRAPSGVYFVVFRTDAFSQTRKLIFLK